MTTNVPDRDLRQRDIIPPEALARCRATVVGVGAIGRQVALQLAAMGISWLQLIDHDTVEAVNLAPQGYLEEDLGRAKVQPTADLCRKINPRMELHQVREKYRRTLAQQDNVLFSCVDSIETRRHIWEVVNQRVEFFSDGRMSAEVIRVLTACDGPSRGHYPTTLFAAGESFQGSCTGRSTIFTANIAAGLMLQQFSRWLRRMPVEPDLSLNLLAGEMTCAAVT